MTIEDALKRAKLLGQARIQREANLEVAQQPGEARVHTDAGRAAPAILNSEAIRRFEPLKTVEISSMACEVNRVFILESQLKEYPSTDAAYRLLRSRLQNRLMQSSWFSLAIASPSQGDGKSLTLLNLAVSIAREKQRPVYVLDLDMRNPTICRFLGIGNLRPLPEYFQGEAKPEDVLAQTSFPNLIVAGALVPAGNPSELLAGPKFGELLAHIRLRSPNACVLVDLPPINVTDEALLVGRRVDAFLVVVSEGKTDRKQLAAALGSLSEFTVAGVVLNRSSDSHTIEYSTYRA